MRVCIKKWGNSAAVRLPASVLASGVFRVDQVVDVMESGGRIIIEPAPVTYELDALLAEMDADTFPDEVEFGPRTGREAW